MAGKEGTGWYARMREVLREARNYPRLRRKNCLADSCQVIGRDDVVTSTGSRYVVQLAQRT